MYVVLAPNALDCPEAYPEWCDVGWFRNYRHIPASARVEPHYHDLPEIYLWHEGSGEALIDGQPVAMRHGMIAYTAAGAHHSIIPADMHSNTGISPKAFPGCRPGHLHTDKTGESPTPKAPSFYVKPEENPFASPRELPRHCFARHVACDRFADAQRLFKRTTESWLALLVREGRLSIVADGHVVEASENQLFIASKGVALSVVSAGESEAALAEGWPAGISR